MDPILWFSMRESKIQTCPEVSRRIQNLKPAGLFAVVVSLVGCVVMADAQQSPKIPRIGLIASRTRSSSQYNVDGFLQGLRDLGYVEEKNIVIDYRYGEGREDLYATLRVT
jgi:hypothetical protein